jgi:aldose 1-epimerase
MHISIGSFGQYKGRDILIFTIEGNNGDQVQILDYGATLHSWITSDKFGKKADIIVGSPDLEGYLGQHPYFGCVVGRYANRINQGCLELEGKSIQLTTNLRNHHLHGGSEGWNRQIFDYQIFKEQDYITIMFTGNSENGDQGYQGNVEFSISYTYTKDNEFIMEYRAISDAPTPINLTNHAYFNLSGEASTILGHNVRISAKAFLEYNDDLIPTGQILLTENTPLDINESQIIGDVMDLNHPLINMAKGFDHCFILDAYKEGDVIATAHHPASGRRLQVTTTEPAIQLYCGNWLSGSKSKSGILEDYSGLCLETQHYPDSPNHAHFPNTILKPGELFYSKTSYLIDVL